MASCWEKGPRVFIFLITFSVLDGICLTGWLMNLSSTFGRNDDTFGRKELLSFKAFISAYPSAKLECVLPTPLLRESLSWALSWPVFPLGLASEDWRFLAKLRGWSMLVPVPLAVLSGLLSFLSFEFDVTSALLPERFPLVVLSFIGGSGSLWTFPTRFTFELDFICFFSSVSFPLGSRFGDFELFTLDFVFFGMRTLEPVFYSGVVSY